MYALLIFGSPDSLTGDTNEALVFSTGSIVNGVPSQAGMALSTGGNLAVARSEERRVGKESRRKLGSSGDLSIDGSSVVGGDVMIGGNVTPAGDNSTSIGDADHLLQHV